MALSSAGLWSRLISGDRVFVIAEAGVNHNGSVDAAMALVNAAKRSGADCVKFQTFGAERIAVGDAPKADYQLKTTSRGESQLAMLKQLELPESAYPDIMAACADEDIAFLSTPYGVEDADLLDRHGATAFKVASGQIVEPAFLRDLAGRGKPLIVSTGMATLAEVGRAVGIVRAAGNDRIALLQCTTNYPSPIEDANLRAMVTMRDAFGVTVGYSDHTQTNTACVAAVSLGARIIEKHFTLDKGLPGPDQSSSADPEEFARLVTAIRETEAALGSALKEPVAAERRNALAMRRSLVSAQPIPAGAVIQERMLSCKRPGTGLAPSQIDDVVGRIARRDIPADVLILSEWLE
jgi:N-acetylneuraminate synthase/N,N'-diacetyllegionaminate synthase